MLAACLKRIGFVVLAAALVLAPAMQSTMAAGMATAAAADASAIAPERCDQCDDGSAGMSAGTCISACAAAAGLVDSFPAFALAAGLPLIAGLAESLCGQLLPPDTGPPKHLPLV
jgi:hypothetical protein